MSVALSPLVSEFETEEQGASYTAWLKAKIQASLNDPRPNIPHDQILSEMAVARLCQSGHRPCMGARLHRVAQQRSSPHPLRHPGTTASWRRQSDTGEASCRLRECQGKTTRKVVRRHARLDTGWECHAQP